MVYLVSSRPQDSAEPRLNALLHWTRRLAKLLAGLILIPPVLLATFLFFSAWKILARRKR